MKLNPSGEKPGDAGQGGILPEEPTDADRAKAVEEVDRLREQGILFIQALETAGISRDQYYQDREDPYEAFRPPPGEVRRWRPYNQTRCPHCDLTVEEEEIKKSLSRFNQLWDHSCERCGYTGQLGALRKHLSRDVVFWGLSQLPIVIFTAGAWLPIWGLLTYTAWTDRPVSHLVCPHCGLKVNFDPDAGKIVIPLKW